MVARVLALPTKLKVAICKIVRVVDSNASKNLCSQTHYCIFLIVQHNYIPILVNGHWGGWNEWSQCSKSCGFGIQTRNRTCDNPAPADGGEDCPAGNTESLMCYNEGCPGKSLCTLTKDRKTINGKTINGSITYSAK